MQKRLVVSTKFIAGLALTCAVGGANAFADPRAFTFTIQGDPSQSARHEGDWHGGRPGDDHDHWHGQPGQPGEGWHGGVPQPQPGSFEWVKNGATRMFTDLANASQQVYQLGPQVPGAFYQPGVASGSTSTFAMKVVTAVNVQCAPQFRGAPTVCSYQKYFRGQPAGSVVLSDGPSFMSTLSANGVNSAGSQWMRVFVRGVTCMQQTLPDMYGSQVVTTCNVTVKLNDSGLAEVFENTYDFSWEGHHRPDGGFDNGGEGPVAPGGGVFPPTSPVDHGPVGVGGPGVGPHPIGPR